MRQNVQKNANVCKKSPKGPKCCQNRTKWIKMGYDNENWAMFEKFCTLAIIGINLRT